MRTKDLLLIGCLILSSAGCRRTPDDPLKDYVSAPDSSYSWKATGEKSKNGFTLTYLELTSQTWREIVWKHKMLVVRPPVVRNPDILLVHVGGSRDAEYLLPVYENISARSGAMVAVVTQVPNQPLFEKFNEDQLVAYTFLRYKETGDPTWPLLYPMTKAVVRSMDAIQEWSAQTQEKKIERFVLTGLSKRGWTLWLAATLDSRIAGIIPMTFDALNMPAQIKAMRKAYGKISHELRYFEQVRFLDEQLSKRMARLQTWVDPYTYRSVYTVPKLLLNSTNDPLWLVDSLRHYWPGLPEPKLVHYAMNMGHALKDASLTIETMTWFYECLATRTPLTTLTWDFHINNSSATVSVTASSRARSFHLWSAVSNDRDFRDDHWSSVPLSSNGMTAHAVVNASTGAFRAFMIEGRFQDAHGHAYRLSTEPRVLPDNP